jgi:RHS repeat-associated protein
METNQLSRRRMNNRRVFKNSMMRNLVSVVLISLSATMIQGQNNLDSDKNYIHKVAPNRPIEESNVNTLDNDHKNEFIQYYDGLGRVDQEISLRNSPSGNDVIHVIRYDELNRPIVDYLPFTLSENDGDYREYSEALSELGSFYSEASNVANTSSPFAESRYEDFIGGNLVESSMPGSAWQMGTEHTVKSRIKYNDASDNALVWVSSHETNIPIVKKTIPEFIDYGTVNVNINSTEIAFEGFDNAGPEFGDFEYSSEQVVLESGNNVYHITDSETDIDIGFEELNWNEYLVVEFKLKGEGIWVFPGGGGLNVINSLIYIQGGGSEYKSVGFVMPSNKLFSSNHVILGKRRPPCVPYCPQEGGLAPDGETVDPCWPAWPYPCGPDNIDPIIYEDTFIDEIRVSKFSKVSVFDDGLVAFENFEADGSSEGNFEFVGENIVFDAPNHYLELSEEDQFLYINGLNADRRYLIKYRMANITCVDGSTSGGGTSLGSWTNVENVISGQTEYLIMKCGPQNLDAWVDDIQVFLLNEPAYFSQIGFENTDIGSYEITGQPTGYHISTPPHAGLYMYPLISDNTISFPDIKQGKKYIGSFWGRGQSAIQLNDGYSTTTYDVTPDLWQKFEFEVEGSTNIVFSGVGGNVYIDDLIVLEDSPEYANDFELIWDNSYPHTEVICQSNENYFEVDGFIPFSGDQFTKLSNEGFNEQLEILNLDDSKHYLLSIATNGANSTTIINDELFENNSTWQKRHIILSKVDKVIVSTENGDSYIDDVRIYPINGELLPGYADTYNPGMLTIKATTDEHGLETKEYFNKLGNKILQRNEVSEDTYLETYYVYDQRGRLRNVIPPEAMEIINSNCDNDATIVYDDYIFSYKYDIRDRLIEKKIPGSGWAFNIYNKLDQLIMTQTPKQHQEAGSWTFLKYDIFGRLIKQGVKYPTSFGSNLLGYYGSSGNYLTMTNSREQLQFLINVEGESIPLWEKKEQNNFGLGYTCRAFPNAIGSNQTHQIQQVNYSDDYDFDNDGTEDFVFQPFNYDPIDAEQYKMPIEVSNRTRGMATGSKVKVLNPQPGGETWITTAIFYDEYGRVIQTQSNNYLGGEEITCTGYDFVGNVLYTKTIHEGKVEENQKADISDHKIIQERWYTYDHANRLIDTYQQNGEQYTQNMRSVRHTDDRVLVSNNVYNELGQLIEKNLHSTVDGNFLQSMDYRYNIRGWLTHINNADLSNDQDYMEEISWSYGGDITAVDLNSITLSAEETTDKYGNPKIQMQLNGIKTVETTQETKLKITTKKGKGSSQDTYAAYQVLVDHPIEINLNGYSLDQGYDLQELLDIVTTMVQTELQTTGVSNTQVLDEITDDVMAFVVHAYGSIYTNNDNTDLWGMELKYTTSGQDINAQTLPQYNGNIAEMHWKSVNNDNKKGYGYTYDALNRITSGKYAERPGSTWNANVGDYNLNNITYDANGNILTLNRNGLTFADQMGVMDDLDYTYNGNQLHEVTEQVDYLVSHANHFSGTGTFRYGYDANGNMVSDQNKGITDIIYNDQNLPLEIEFENNRSITYVYDAMGGKHHKIVNDNGTIQNTWYLNGYQYTDQGLSFAGHEEGRLMRNAELGMSGRDGQFRYEYHYKDHLGNLRLAFSDINFDNHIDEQTEVLQEVNYYPFGLEHSYGTIELPPLTEPEHQYKYNGKEKQTEFNLNWLDYGARFYDPALGRWQAVDPMAHLRTWVSPYNFVQNNPINRVDPTGALDDWVQDADGNIYWDDNATSQATTKEGETYLGEDLTFTFNSYINSSFDGPTPPWPVEGDKLTSTITLDATKNADGSLQSVNVTSDYFVHETGGISMFKGRNYFPGLGDDQNKAINLTGVRSFNATFEQHASVPGFEAAGLNLMGYDIVNVAQQMNLSLSGNQLSISAATDVFPSATLSVNGLQLFQYNQPSFRATHGRNRSFIDNGRGGVEVISTPRRPAPSFYPRYQK